MKTKDDQISQLRDELKDLRTHNINLEHEIRSMLAAGSAKPSEFEGEIRKIYLTKILQSLDKGEGSEADKKWWQYLMESGQLPMIAKEVGGLVSDVAKSAAGPAPNIRRKRSQGPPVARAPPGVQYAPVRQSPARPPTTEQPPMRVVRNPPPVKPVPKPVPKPEPEPEPAENWTEDAGTTIEEVVDSVLSVPEWAEAERDLVERAARAVDFGVPPETPLKERVESTFFILRGIGSIDQLRSYVTMWQPDAGMSVDTLVGGAVGV